MNSIRETFVFRSANNVLSNTAPTAPADVAPVVATPKSEPFAEAAAGPRISPRLAAKIVDAVSSSRLTIVIGPTGCGKSTRVPAVLLDGLASGSGSGGGGGAQILCTQPRRLAVVAVAGRVAFERSVPLGGSDVGYHIGQSNLSTRSTRLLFTTAGILLEELRANGVDALTRFRCVLIDECHERSPESDLVLAIVKSFMRAHPTAPIRLVLMSATFNQDRYRTYFADVPGCGDAQSINLETASMFRDMHSRVSVHYVEEFVGLLPDAGDHAALARRLRINPHGEIAGDDGGKSVTENMLDLIRSLVRFLDREEPTEGTFMIFAPTYRQLEQVYDELSDLVGAGGHLLAINVLHSSVDIEDCLRSMSSKRGGVAARNRSGRRKILLASAIADSSVTVPGVTVIIDLCRALEVRWDVHERNHVAKTVWASKSICDQRKGRTGRTCPGRVFRLVTRGFYVSALESYDVPQLALSSCQNETLKMLCSSHKVMSDPAGLLKRCLDSPPEEVVRDSISYLKEIGACETRGRSGRTQKLAPTIYGELLAALPFSVKDSVIFVAGAQLGVLHETLVLRAIMSHKPAPIVHHFGDQYLSDTLLRRYYPDVRTSDPKSVTLANLSAYLYWEVNFNASRAERARLLFEERTEGGGGADARYPDCNVWRWTEETEEEHVEWCREHGINPSSVRSIAEMADTTLNVLFWAHFEPDWLRCASSTPLWRRPDDWKGVGDDDEYDMLERVYGEDGAPLLCEALSALCVDGGRSTAASSAALALSGGRSARREHAAARRREGPVACVHFLMGNCKFGNRCRNSHSPDAPRPMCRFYQAGNCTNGDACVFSHGEDDREECVAADEQEHSPMDAIAPLIDSLSLAGGPLAWNRAEAKKLLLLGEGNLSFFSSLLALSICPLAGSCREAIPQKTNSSALIGGVDATRLHLDRRIQRRMESGRLQSFVWNFPFNGSEEDEAGNEALLLGTFHSLTKLVKDYSPEETPWNRRTYRFGVALQGDQLARWYVLRSALRTGWALSAWGPFDPDDFPGYQPSRADGEPFTASNMKFYVFEHTVGHVV